MTHAPHDFASRLDDLSSRVKRIEDRLQMAPGRPSRGAPPIATRAEALRETQPAHVIAPSPLRKPGVARRPSREWSVERFVGGRLFAVVGALVVIAGAGLGLKLAWDMGFFRLLSDAGKSVAMAGFGAALLALGEFARRRWGRAAGEGLSAAGLGVLFASVYAMTARFGLLDWLPAVGALLGVAALGFIISARAGFTVTPAVAVVGGFTAPLLLGEPTGSAGVLVLYWLSLSASAHALSAFYGSNFAPARACAWWGSIVVGGFWALHEMHDGATHWSVICVIGVWALCHAELWRACARRVGEWPRHLLQRSVTAGVSTTLWATVFGFIAAGVYDWNAWMVPAVFAQMNLALALSLVGPRGLARTPSGSRELLAVSLALLAGALALLTALVALAGWFEPVVIVLAGLACVAAGARVRAEWLRGYGFANLVIGTLIALSAVTLRSGASVEVGALEFTRWSAVVAVAGVAWLGAAVVHRTRAHAPGFASACLVLFFAACVSNQPDLRWLVGAWGVLSGVFVLAQLAVPRLRPALVGLAGLLATASLWWLAFDTVSWNEGVVYGAGLLSVHEGLLGAIILAGALCATSWTVWRTGAPGGAQRVLAGVGYAGAVVLSLTATSLDTARLAELTTDDETARRAAVSIWWGVYAIGLLLLGGWQRVALVRHAGLVLIGIATLKAVFFDLAAVAPGWRVASFLLLGLLLLGVATAYARSAAREGASSTVQGR